MIRVLLVHHYYQQRGGDDQCFEDEVQVLTNHGIEVACFSVHNESIHERSKLGVALGTVWSRDSAKTIRERIDSFQPDVMHAMNTFPLLSPSVLRAAKKRRVAVVQEVPTIGSLAQAHFCFEMAQFANNVYIRGCRLPLFDIVVTQTVLRVALL
ncbi:MAG: hypothetical protein ACK5PB_06310 [Pirellula sp.]